MPKHRTGHLFRRGRVFYVRWAINGKVFQRALKDDQGNSITNRRDAEEAKIKLMAPFTVTDEAAALEALAAKLQGRKAELVRLDDQINPPLPIAQAWKEFVGSPNRPDSGEATFRQYAGQFGHFVRWMSGKHPERPTLRELTVDELRTICESAQGELRLLLALGIYTSMRLGDCSTLRWAEVDLARGIIRRIPNKTARRNPRPVMIPIHPALGEMLLRAPRRNEANMFCRRPPVFIKSARIGWPTGCRTISRLAASRPTNRGPEPAASGRWWKFRGLSKQSGLKRCLRKHDWGK